LNPRVYVEVPTPSVDPEDSIEAVLELRAQLDERTSRGHQRGAIARQGGGLGCGAGRGEPEQSWTSVVRPRNIKHNRISDEDLDAAAPRTAEKLTSSPARLAAIG
jgi:hypothetical protein